MNDDLAKITGQEAGKWVWGSVLETDVFHDCTEHGYAHLHDPGSTFHPPSNWEGNLASRFHQLTIC